MSQVQLRDDDLLTTLATQAEAGETVTLLRGDKPIAQIIPFPATDQISEEQRMAALDRLTAIMDKGYDMGLTWNGRDELYDHDTNTKREAALAELQRIINHGYDLSGMRLEDRDELYQGGRASTQITPVSAQTSQQEDGADIAWDRLRAAMDRGLDLGGIWNGRDELYDRD